MTSCTELKDLRSTVKVSSYLDKNVTDARFAADYITDARFAADYI